VKTLRRVAVAVTIAAGVALLLSILWKGSTSELFFRAIVLALSATTVFSLFEVWPRRLPRGIERWILQVVAVGWRAGSPTSTVEMSRWRGRLTQARPSRFLFRLRSRADTRVHLSPVHPSFATLVSGRTN
jgi:hypothetical protein